MTRTPKNTIENIHVDHINGSRFAIGWEIDGNRFHIWASQPMLGRRELEGTIYKNPPRAIERGAPGHFETRKLNAEHKSQAAIMAAVLAIVDRDQLLAKARKAERDRFTSARLKAELEHAIAYLEAEALAAFRSGEFAMNATALNDLYQQHKTAMLALAALNSSEAAR